MTKKIPRGYKEALEAIDAELKAKPCVVRFIHMNDFTDNSNPGKHGSRRRIREKSILTTFKWKVCVLNDIQLKWYLHHCVGLKLNFQVIYLFWCLARPVRCFWEVFAIHGTTFRYARLVEKIGALWSRSVHVNTKTRGQTLLNIHEILYPIRLYLHLSADFRTILICKKTPEIWRTKVNGPPYDYF